MTWKTIDNPLFWVEKNDAFAKFHFQLANKKPPKELFHYTSGEGLMAILESQCVFATERKFLNDPKEFQWGVNLFNKFLNDQAARKYPDEFISLVRDALYEKGNDDLRLFIFSLSANPDLLSQWRAYAVDGTGFALGFDGHTLRDRSGFGGQVLKGIDLDKMPEGFCYCYHLLPVVYDKNEQTSVLSEFLEAAHNFWERFDDRDESNSRHLFQVLVQHRVKELLISLKNPGFREECEWRIVATVHKLNEKIGYRHGRFGITPYVKLNLSPRDKLPHLKLHLRSLWVGPTSPAITNKRGIEMFLASNKVDVGLTFSEIEYRS